MPLTPLAQLNKSSAQIASWTVRAAGGRIVRYSHTSKYTGKLVSHVRFEVYLVGNKANEYCLGYVKGTDVQCYDAQAKYKDQTLWIMSKVALDTHTAPAFVSTPVRSRVDLSKTIMKATTPEQAADMPEQPIPPRSVADVAAITTNSSCDLLALIKDVSETRTTTSGLKVADVTLLDGSAVKAGGLAAQIGVSVFDENKIQRAKASVGKPMVFFNLSVQTGINGPDRRINHWGDDIMREPPQCEKTTKLIEKATELKAAESETLTSVWVSQTGPRDVSGPQPLSCAAFLDYTSELPTAQMPEVVQLMWLHMESPAPDASVTIDDKSGASRIWCRLLVRDVSGSVSVGVPEKVALALSSCDNKDEFLRKHQSGELAWPLLLHARVSRRARAAAQERGASQPAEASQGPSSLQYVNHVMEAAEAVSWARESAPNAAYEGVLSILNNCPPHDEGIVFAYMSDIEADPHYGFAVNYEGTPGPRSLYVAALVASGAKSKKQSIGENGYQITTESVKDIANPAGTLDDPVGSHTLTGFCTLDGLSAFELAPARGKKFRVALALFSRVDEDGSFLLHGLQHVEPDSVETAVACMQRLRRLSVGVRPTSDQKRSRAVAGFADSDATKSTKAARTLQRCGTGASLPEKKDT